MIRENTTVQIPFGLKNGEMISVNDVGSGLDCECLCPSCRGLLIAKKRSIHNTGKFTNHFAHHHTSNLSECTSAFETSVHFMAKQIIEEQGFINLPELKIKVSANDKNNIEHTESSVAITECQQTLANVVLEKGLSDIRPDIIAQTLNGTLLIEVAVTHFSDSDKKSKIRALGLDAIEIDLSKINYSITKEQLKEAVISSLKNKKWLSLQEAPALKIKLKQQLKERILKENTKIYRAAEINACQPQNLYQRRSFINKAKTEEPSQWEIEQIGARFKCQHHRYPSISETNELIRRYRNRFKG